MKALWDEVDGRILLGDKTNGGTIMLRPITFKLFTLRISTKSFCTDVYTHTHTHTHIYIYIYVYIYHRTVQSTPDCTKFDLRRTVRKSGTVLVIG